MQRVENDENESSSRGAERRGDPVAGGRPTTPGLLRCARNDDRGSTPDAFGRETNGSSRVRFPMRALGATLSPADPPAGAVIADHLARRIVPGRPSDAAAGVS